MININLNKSLIRQSLSANDLSNLVKRKNVKNNSSYSNISKTKVHREVDNRKIKCIADKSPNED